MRVLLALIIVITVLGVLLLGSMFARGDLRLGMTGLIVLIAGQTMATVYAILQE